MSLLIGDTAPNFIASTTKGEINFHEYIGDSWCVLFSHPASFTPVCTTELGQAANLELEFKKRNAKIITISVDQTEDQIRWIEDINETQNSNLQFPLISDSDRKISDLYGMIHPNASDTMTVRNVFIIDPFKKIRLTLAYPASTGRNFVELLRVIDSLQLTSNYKVATPVDWKDGEDTIILPAIKDEEISNLFPKGHTVIKPYLRTTPQPNK
jgi:alkyl hydroperoxide reductase subunit AhpC|tara:strand:+ start:277 stop:912 length:636 start_codon:yes stop_codon:yes gene_type:complete